MKRQAYICGPYSASSEARNLMNIRAALKMGILLLETKGLHPIVPHVGLNHGTEWNVAMDHDYKILRSLNPEVDMVITLEGWRDSAGSLTEVDLANKLGIPVYAAHEVIV